MKPSYAFLLFITLWGIIPCNIFCYQPKTRIEKMLANSKTAIEKIKEYAKDERVREYIAKGALVATGAAGFIVVKKGINFLLDTDEFKDGFIGRLPCKMIKGRNGVVVQVNNQVGSTCGFHAIKNSGLITDALMSKGKKNLTKELLKKRDDLFISSRDAAYFTTPSHGVWRAQIEQMRKEHNEIIISDSWEHGNDRIEQGLIEYPYIDVLNVTELVYLIDYACAHDGLGIEASGYSNIVVFSPNHNFSGNEGRVMNSKALSEHIAQFKQDANKVVLPIIINVTRHNHWIVDVLFKKKDNEIIHIVADSLNSTRLNSPEIQTIMAIS